MVPEAQMLDSDEYWALLGPTSVECPAVVTDGPPHVLPVSFKPDGQGILLRTGRGGKLQAIEANAMVAS